MQLTQFTDYSLRALIYIALRKELCTINDIANAYTISSNHLLKIIHNLAKMGVIKTTRGKSGGITMAQNPSDINLGELVIKLEPNFDLVPCFNKEKANCCIAPACKLKRILFDAKESFLAVLKQYSLEDILDNQMALKELLSIDDVFGDLINEYGEPGLLLKGLRNREDLSQIELATILNISQTNLSAMENGRRSIGKELAKRIAETFKVDYRIFL